MKAKSITGKSTEDIQSALAEITKDGFKPTLAFVFITNIANATPVCELMDKEGIAVFGISTSEKFNEQGLEPDDIVALLLDINSAYFKIVLQDFKEYVPYECARQTGTIGMNAFNNPGFIISCADIKLSGEDLIDGLMATAGDGVTVMGGVAGNPADFSGIVFTNNASSTGGLLALIIDQDKIAISGLAVSGWKPAGTMKKITKSDGFWIYTIDDEPAMNVLQKFLGNEVVNFNNAPQGLLPVDIGYPLQFQRKSGTPIMRPVLLWNTDDRSIMVGGQIKETENFRFSLPPDFDAIDTVIQSTRMIKEKNMPDVDALLVFSCVGRLGSFGPMISAEIEGLAATWKKPMIGFFSLGEFGKLEDSQCEFHGTTVSWVALKEK
ncbi:MAG: FIST C-terminal domain-containing protein [Bacteroidota bacterium]|nr:FIST C-terminal domain-containing protein [Bacteroidota bacterium]